MFWSKLNKSNWNCAWNLAAFLYLSHLLYGIICVKIFIMNRYISKSYTINEQEYYWPTILRAGAAVVSTTTSVDPKIIIHECAGLISVSLCNLFKKSLHSSIFTAVFTPLFKQGEASFERIVYDQLYSNFWSNEDIISTHQSGFRS